MTLTTSESKATSSEPIIVVCQVFHPDQQSTSQLLSDMMSRLAAKGHAITVLCGYPGKEMASDLPRIESWKGISICRGGIRAGFKRSLWKRMLAYVSFSWFVVWQLMSARRRQRVFVVTNPPFAPVVVWLVGIIKQFRITVMLHDIYPDGLVATGRLRKGGLVEKLWGAFNGRAYRAADEVWVLGRDMRDLVVQNYRVPLEKIQCVPHWSPVEPDKVKEPESTRLWGELGLQGKFIVQYSGNMGLWHDIETIIQAAALMRDDQRVHFLFIGSGIKRFSAEQLAHKLGLVNITWLPFLDRDQLSDSLACCHVALISQLDQLIGVAVPSKLYGILASGRAVVAQVPSRSEVARVLVEEDCGVVIPPGDSRALADALRDLATKPEKVRSQSERAFAAYHTKYTLERAAEKFHRLWENWKRL